MSKAQSNPWRPMGRRSRTAGYTLIELAIVLALTAATTLIGFEGWQFAIVRHRANQVMQSVNSVHANIVESTSGSPNTTGINTFAMVKLGVWPVSRVTDAKTSSPKVVNEFLGNEWVNGMANNFSTGTGATIAGGTAYRYTISRIPKSACSIMVNELSKLASVIIVRPFDGLNVGNNLVSIWGNGSLSHSIALAKDVDRPIDPVSVDRACYDPSTAELSTGRQTLELVIRMR